MIEIIQAEAKHIPEIKELFLEFGIFHQTVDASFTPGDDAMENFETNILKKHMESEDGLVLAAVYNNRIVGFSVSEVQEPWPGLKREKYGHIVFMAVTADYRRMGLAKKMLDKIIEWFHSKKLNRAEIYIVTNNKTAASFWGKQGFITYTQRMYKEI